MTETVAPPGHNKPPMRAADDIPAHLELTYAENLERLGALLDKAPAFFVVTNDQEDAEATEFMVKVRAAFKAAEAARVAEKQPYDDGAGAVQSFFKKRLLDPLGAAPTDKRVFDPATRTELGIGPRINMAQTIYKTAKEADERRKREEEAAAAAAEERRKREEAAEAERVAAEAAAAAARKRNAETRAAAEAEAARLAKIAADKVAAEQAAATQAAAAAKAATASSADLSRARGGKGGVSSLQESVDFHSLDRKTIDLNALREHISDESLEKAVRSYIRANDQTIRDGIAKNESPIKGVTFYMAKVNRGRA